MLMAASASVTVSMAALTMGTLRLIRRVSRVLTVTSLGRTSEKLGSSSRSSKEYASCSGGFGIETLLVLG